MLESDSSRRYLTNSGFMVQTDLFSAWSESLLAVVLLSLRKTAQISCFHRTLLDLLPPSSFEEDGSWVPEFRRISTPVFRRLRQCLWDMGRGEMEQTCEWDVAGGELCALEDFLRAMAAFEPAERPTADQLLRPEYMVKWALPAWERQKRQKRTHPVVEEH